MIVALPRLTKENDHDFCLSIDASSKFRATSILLSYDGVLEVKVNCNEECALMSEAGKNRDEPRDLGLIYDAAWQLDGSAQLDG